MRVCFRLILCFSLFQFFVCVCQSFFNIFFFFLFAKGRMHCAESLLSPFDLFHLVRRRTFGRRESCFCTTGFTETTFSLLFLSHPLSFLRMMLVITLPSALLKSEGAPNMGQTCRSPRALKKKRSVHVQYGCTLSQNQNRTLGSQKNYEGPSSLPIKRPLQRAIAVCILRGKTLLTNLSARNVNL